MSSKQSSLCVVSKKHDAVEGLNHSERSLGEAGQKDQTLASAADRREHGEPIGVG